MPQEPILYFADTAHLPYGEQPQKALRHYTTAALSFLKHNGAERLIVACGTVSATVLPDLAPFGVPVQGVIAPAVAQALSHWRGGVVGVIGTEATVKSGAFAKALRQKRPDLPVRQVACPLFVALAECGYAEGEQQTLHFAAHHYLSPFLEREPDVLILGCTHFPLLRRAIERLLPHTYLVDCGASAVQAITAKGAGSCAKQGEKQKVRCFVTSDSERFAQKAAFFLPEAEEWQVIKTDITI